ncbi:uncharacterized protein YutE (UPF0331/DUF86 family) [Paenibacillus anaericanus]|uniref:DUF86 domain-containing protein n=1 Tax=Paenibacillus TaxID=44249 RepID=UPI00278B1F32|nr:HepT-like ribonuclease domain-containing protein [Paenibacillus anaericanus]MDQ0086828.1 uncharacterized protein YutE (UPF0331/DUF86 family) [Paenibacillus anaericanus]
MYYVNREQIERRLNMLPELVQVLRATNSLNEKTLIEHYAEGRALHLAIEVVTDVGSYLIDGFIMRDASSYEDIVDIIYGEGVIDDDLHLVLIELVRLRKPLVQDYIDWNGQGTRELINRLPECLEVCAKRVRDYLDNEGIKV